MALPQKVIEQLGREPPKTPGWSGELLIFTTTVFAITIFIYLGLVYGYQSYLDKGVTQLQDQIQAFGQQIPVDEQAKLINFYSQVANLRSLLSNHVISSRVFSWLEKNTQANTYVTRFSFDSTTNALSFGLRAKTMPDVLQQIAVFENLPEIASISIGSMSFSDNAWQFTVDLKLAPGYFNYGSGGSAQAGQSQGGKKSP